MRKLLSIVAAIFLVAASASAAVVHYTYDEIGRLVGVYAPSGDAAQYLYDAAGNITQINRFTSSQISVIEFTPNSGPVGTTVTIRGTGFSATPANNTVTFNGAGATVSAASINQLTVTVPGGATTGLISVTVAGNTANSSANFIVSAAAIGAPTITSFSPSSGAAGTAITITGTNFDTTPANDQVSLNLTSASVSSATSTSISTSVPSTTGSGKIKVRTSAGTAISTNDFLVTFGSYAASDLISTNRVVVDGSAASFTIGSAGKVAMVLFEGTQGQNVGIGFTSMATSPVGGTMTVNVLRPDNVAMMLTASSAASSTWTMDLPTLPMTGTYAIAISTDGTHTGSGAVTLSSDVVTAITEGSTITTAVRAGQNARYTFSGAAGQSFGVYISSIAFALQVVRVDLINPWGLVMATATSQSAIAFIPMQALSINGTYTILVSPSPGGTGSFSVQYGAPDFTITSLIPGTPWANQSGSYSIPFTAVIANQGTLGVKGFLWYDRFYLSTDATLDTADRTIFGTNRSIEVPSGTNYTITATGTAPAGTTPGTYTLFAKTDGTDNGTFYTAGGTLAESNENNNVTSASIIIAGLPDLSPSNLSVGTITVNGSGAYLIPITFTVTNLGPGSAHAGWFDKCYLSTDSVLDSSDGVIGSATRNTDVAALGSYNVSMTCVTPTTTTAGGYTLFVKADSLDGSNYSGFGALTEASESNNVISTSITLPNK